MDLCLQLLQTIVGFLVLVLLYNVCVAKNSSNKPKDAPEAAGAWPVIGHLYLLGRQKNLVETLGAMADRYGPVFTLWMGTRRTLVVSSWETAKECFTTNDLVLATRPNCAAGKHLAYNNSIIGFAPYGPYWRGVRKISTIELLSNRRLDDLKHIRANEIGMCIKELYNLWVKNHQKPVRVEMNRWFKDLTCNVMLMIIAGKRYFGTGGVSNGCDAKQFQKAIGDFSDLLGVFDLSDALPFLEWMDFQGYKRSMKKTAKELDSIVGNWLDEHRQKRLSGKVEGENDFIDVMLSIREDGLLYGYDPDTVVKANCLALIIAGTDTTTITITWALSLLLNNPHVLKRAQDELDTLVGKERHVEESDVKNLVYLQAIIKETLRMYPAAPLALPHEAREDCHIGGFFVPAGTRILVNLQKLQHDPRVWSDPMEFRPERFLSSQADVDFRGQHFEYIPFGSGRRSCPGISFASQVLLLTLAHLLHAFELMTPSGEPIDMTETMSITLAKATPLEAILTPRLNHDLYQ